MLLTRNPDTDAFTCPCGQLFQNAHMLASHCGVQHPARGAAEGNGWKTSIPDNQLGTDEFLESIGFRVNMHYNLLICMDCQKTILPSHIAGHLKSSHGFSLASINEKLQETVKQYAIYEDTSMPQPPPYTKRVEGLPMTRGLKCKDCDYACGSKETARAHHNAHPLKTVQFEECFVQSYFVGPYPKRYFAVTPPSEPAQEQNLYDVYKTTIKPTIPKVELNAPESLREINPLLKKTEWHLYLGDRMLKPSWRSSIRTLVETATDKEPWSTVISESVDKYLRDVRAMALGSPQLLRRLVIHEEG